MFLDLVVVAKYPEYWWGQASYSYKTFEIMTDDIEQKVSDDMAEYREKHPSQEFDEQSAK